MMMNNAAANTSSLFQKFHVVFGFIYVLRSLARCRPSQIQVEAEAAVVVVRKGDDLEAGPPKEVQNSVFKKALSILPPFPASLCMTLPGLFALLHTRWQLPLLAFPSSTLHKWYISGVSSLILEFVVSVAQWIISAKSGP